MRISKQKQTLFQNCRRALKNNKLNTMLLDSVPNLFMKSKRSGAMSMCIFFNLFLLYMYGGIISDDQFRNNFITVELNRLGFLKRVGHVKRPDYNYEHVLHDYNRLDDIEHIGSFNTDYHTPSGKLVLIQNALTLYKMVRDRETDINEHDYNLPAIENLKLNLRDACYTLQHTPRCYTLCKLSKYGCKYIEENHLEPIFKDLKSIYLKNARKWAYIKPTFSKSRCNLVFLKDPIEKLSFVQAISCANNISYVIGNWYVRRAIYNFWKNYCIKNRVILPNINHIAKSLKLNGMNHVSLTRIYRDYNFVHSRSNYLLKRDLCKGDRGTFMTFYYIGIVCW